jgi:hypothetical protein
MPRLKLGIHTLRGSVSAAAIAAKSPILNGGGATVDQIATTGCSWNKGWYAVNMSHPAAVPWFDSVYGQYAAWGVDLIKNDCIFAQNMVAVATGGGAIKCPPPCSIGTRSITAMTVYL